MRKDERIPLLDHPVGEPSLFRPESLLDRAAEMRGVERTAIPPACVLDFDGELVPVAIECFGAQPCEAWACFHTTLYRIDRDGREMGLIGGTVGAPFAVLVAEELIASGCRHIIGYSSSGAIAADLTLPCLVVPDRALRDEGTSYHYAAPAAWAHAHGRLPEILPRHAASTELPVHVGPTWTTDAPYRETLSQVERHRAAGVLSVEMEAAALMALSGATGAEIASLLHVTNALGTGETDFHKGPDDINERVLRCCFETFVDALG